MTLTNLLETADFGDEVSGSQIQTDTNVDDYLIEEDEVINDPDYMMTQFSSSLLVTYLYDQVQNTDFEELQSNQLENILLRINIVLNKFNEDTEVRERLVIIKHEILIKVIAFIEDKYDIVFAEFGLDVHSDNFETEALALYEFFIVNRLKNIKTFCINYILQNKKAIIERYKDSIPKANQTFREIKKRSDTRVAYLIIASSMFIEDKNHINDLMDISTFNEYVQDHTYIPDTIESIARYIDGKDILMDYFYTNLENVISSIGTEVRSEVATYILSEE